ncbi:MAG: alpha-1,4-glucan--maltose-1-phosphate maltosyltransferase [Verrucomicrobiota bacterium]
MSLSDLLPEGPTGPSAQILNPYPWIDGGRYPVKRTVGEKLEVYADVFRDGHDLVAAALCYRPAGDSQWRESDFRPLEQDRWGGQLRFPEVGAWEYTIVAWPDDIGTWLRDFQKKLDAGLADLSVEIEEGALLLETSARLASQVGHSPAAEQLATAAQALRLSAPAESRELILAEPLPSLWKRYPDRRLATFHPIMRAYVESERARFSAWYEFFPRNAHHDGQTHGTFRDCLPMLDHAARLGFDVVYLPPIHPIGQTNRKGKNNTKTAEPDDVGSPWAIGGPAGGHYEVEPALGSVDDFVWLVQQAKARGLEIALDYALNCSPDHPYVTQHPDWFQQRPDGSIKFAENPPKKYEDIYPLNFHCADWKNLWQELTRIVLCWCERGVRLYRVDNPHTKPVAFWEYLIATVRRRFPDTLFLSEAFTQPRMMQVLGKAGFSQSYTYFTWRTSKQELIDYVNELTQGPMKDFYRANFWPNTPDILAYELWNAPREKFMIRAFLAATLSPSWGIYSGFELCENQPLPPKEEYLHSEKYQLVARDWEEPGHIGDFIQRLNQIRRRQPALQEYTNVGFCRVANDQLLAYTRMASETGSPLLLIVNLDPERKQEGTVHLESLGLAPGQRFTVRDLLTGKHYSWSGPENYVALDPEKAVAHLFELSLP